MTAYPCELAIGLSPVGLTSLEGNYMSFFTSLLNTDADMDITFPRSLTLGYKYEINDKWDAEADFTWMMWSSFDQMDFAFSQSSHILAGFEPVNKDFKDVFSLNLGTSLRA